MTIHVPITPETEAWLRSRAEARGEDLQTYVGKLLSHLAQPPTPLEELSGPIYQAFKESGLTDDELGDLLDKAKHEMRAERRARRPS